MLLILIIDLIGLLQTLAALLYEANSECGYVKCKRLQEIFGVSEREAHLGTLPKGLLGVTDKSLQL